MHPKTAAAVTARWADAPLISLISGAAFFKAVILLRLPGLRPAPGLLPPEAILISPSCPYHVISELLMVMTAHYVLHCKDCKAPMWLPSDTIEQLFVDPDDLPNDSHAIGAVCRLCKSVGTYFLERNSPGHNPKDGAIIANRAEGTVVLPQLGCAVESCKPLLPIVVQWNPATTAAERRADIETWRWENLRCPMGHPIPKPRW
jgi:hypothetical protein